MNGSSMWSTWNTQSRDNIAMNNGFNKMPHLTIVSAIDARAFIDIDI